jgi:methionine synthase II (cobalamin-independent)
MTGIRGLATGIGSLPHKDAGSAVDLVLKCLPEIPFWPQLPKRSVKEGMVAQFSENMPCLKVTPDGLMFDPRQYDKELESFYERIIANDTDHFKISEDFAPGLYELCRRLKNTGLNRVEFIKCQITGPFTFAASINSPDGKALISDPIFMQAVIKGLAMKGLWQIDKLKEFGKKIIIFMDEPYLACFGSAFSPLSREDAVSGLSELSRTFRSAGALVGVHCCGNTDWSIFTDDAGVDLINFDAYGFWDKLAIYAPNLKAFLKNKGLLCWGIVPTQEFGPDISQDLLLAKIESGIAGLIKKGLDRDMVLDNLLVSPSCGLGTLDVDKAEQILDLLKQLSLRLRKR